MKNLLLRTAIKNPGLRCSQLLQAAGVTDRRAGEDAVYDLTREGYLVLAADSTLRIDPFAFQD